MMTGKSKRLAGLSAVMVALIGVAFVWQPREAASATLPSWATGAFVTASEKYANRRLVIEQGSLRFESGTQSVSVLAVQRIEPVKGPETVLSYDVHVLDGGAPSTMRLTVAPADSSVRLQTMPSVVWYRVGTRDIGVPSLTVDVAADRPVATAAPVTAPSGAPSVDLATPPVAEAAAPASDNATPAGSVDLNSDRNRDVRQLLEGAIGPCRTNGCRIGVRGLTQGDYPAFIAFLTARGVKHVTLTPMASVSRTLAILHIEPDRSTVADTVASPRRSAQEPVARKR